MLYFESWKVTLILLVCALGVILSIPNLLSPQTLARWPNWVPKKQVSLGLDLRGGSHLLLEVDMASVQKEQLNNVVDELRTALVAAKIGYTGLAVDDDHVVLTLRDKGDEAAVRAAVAKIDPDLTMTMGDGGAVAIRQNPVALEARRASAVEQSIEIIRRRIDETGTKEANIQRVGSDRVLVQLPGVDNPEHVKELIGKTAKMTFQLVDTNASVEDARRGKLPPGDELL
jgi:preprotein translocase subunit SecD